MSGRFCQVCNHPHGQLYVCPNYSPELQAEVRAEGELLRANLSDQHWVERQLNAGIPQWAIDGMRAMAGIK